jgi:hypothetical protein
MGRRVHVLGATLGVAFLAGAFQAAATTITATSYSSWNTSTYITGSTTVVDLTTLQAGLNYSNAMGYTSNGFNFTGPDGASYVLTTAYEANPNSNGLLGASDGTGVIDVTMPGSGNSAFLFNAQCITCSGLTLTLSDGETFSISNGQFGASISHNITWFKLNTTSGTRPFLEYVYFGTSALPQDAPQAKEAATFVLIGGGLLTLAGAGRRSWMRVWPRTKRHATPKEIQGFA